MATGNSSLASEKGDSDNNYSTKQYGRRQLKKHWNKAMKSKLVLQSNFPTSTRLNLQEINENKPTNSNQTTFILNEVHKASSAKDEHIYEQEDEAEQHSCEIIYWKKKYYFIKRMLRDEIRRNANIESKFEKIETQNVELLYALAKHHEVQQPQRRNPPRRCRK